LGVTEGVADLVDLDADGLLRHALGYDVGHADGSSATRPRSSLDPVGQLEMLLVGQLTGTGGGVQRSGNLAGSVLVLVMLSLGVHCRFSGGSGGLGRFNAPGLAWPPVWRERASLDRHFGGGLAGRLGDRNAVSTGRFPSSPRAFSRRTSS
jgi:hypothetical protein